MSCDDNPRFTEGQRVHVELDGTIVNQDAAGDWYMVDAGAGYKHVIYTSIPGHQVTITAAEPESWPPQAGDVWKANGQRWFARLQYTALMLVNENTTKAALRPDAFKARNPVLAWRDNA